MWFQGKGLWHKWSKKEGRQARPGAAKNGEERREESPETVIKEKPTTVRKRAGNIHQGLCLPTGERKPINRRKGQPRGQLGREC